MEAPLSRPRSPVPKMWMGAQLTVLFNQIDWGTEGAHFYNIIQIVILEKFNPGWCIYTLVQKLSAKISEKFLCVPIGKQTILYSVFRYSVLSGIGGRAEANLIVDHVLNRLGLLIPIPAGGRIPGLPPVPLKKV